MSSASLLPPNAAPAERSIEAAATAREVPVVIRELWNPAECPAPLLPWQAWGLSVDTWQPSWSDAQKRASIAASIPVHRQKGTVAALKTALGALGFRAYVVEWFQQLPVAAPYTFGIDIEVTDTGITESIYLDAERIAATVKNARSHLSRVRAIARSTGEVRVGLACLSSEVTAVYPFQMHEITARATVSIAAAAAASESTSVYPRAV